MRLTKNHFETSYETYKLIPLIINKRLPQLVRCIKEANILNQEYINKDFYPHHNPKLQRLIGNWNLKALENLTETFKFSVIYIGIDSVTITTYGKDFNSQQDIGLYVDFFTKSDNEFADMLQSIKTISADIISNYK